MPVFAGLRLPLLTVGPSLAAVASIAANRASLHPLLSPPARRGTPSSAREAGHSPLLCHTCAPWFVAECCAFARSLLTLRRVTTERHGAALLLSSSRTRPSPGTSAIPITKNVPLQTR
jgi:hypothetical protein